MKNLCKRHRDGRLATRMRLRGRLLLCDMDLIERHVPRAGTVVDIGCGPGFFSQLLALRSPEREVLGLDIDEGVIRHARETGAGLDNLEFVAADAFEYNYPPCDAITILDITYLLPKELQCRLLDICRQNLKPGGRLVWKTQDTWPRWKYAFMYGQEVATSLMGMTPSRQRSFFYMSRSEALAAMEAAGFNAEVVEMPTRLPYADVLYIGS